ncbi:hypothetical protein PENNAL_c0016G06862 [Penicillium nalgiovense]|uniref:Uncharacterized protein n=1 Tax=Penicillium nalgiovense TaxID=60175 RepID=A0A1V6YMX8_PENNA|nr:hypothetical protein PENNAL_c0016G06862 [Penicillium nalgiovense]
MRHAIESGNNKQFKILLTATPTIHDLRQNPEEKTLLETALYIAGEAGNMELTKTLLKANVNGLPFEDGGMTPLQQAAEQGNMELVNLFLKAGANVDQEPASHKGMTALQFAAIQGYIRAARKLLDAGASVQAPRPERYGRTVFEGAAEHGRLDMGHQASSTKLPLCRGYVS